FLRSFFPVNADVHRSSLGGVAKRVDQQVEKHLRDPVRVDGKGRFAGKVVEREMNSLFGGLGTDALQNSPQKGGNVRRFPFQRQLLRLRQGQLMKILDEAGETDQFVLQGQKVFRRDRPAALLQEIQPAPDDGERCSQFVGDVRSEEHTSELQSRENLV